MLVGSEPKLDRQCVISKIMQDTVTYGVMSDVQQYDFRIYHIDQHCSSKSWGTGLGFPSKSVARMQSRMPDNGACLPFTRHVTCCIQLH